jgi:hypothetical protein
VMDRMGTVLVYFFGRNDTIHALYPPPHRALSVHSRDRDAPHSDLGSLEAGMRTPSRGATLLPLPPCIPSQHCREVLQNG